MQKHGCIRLVCDDHLALSSAPIRHARIIYLIEGDSPMDC